jgi:hypothetical protein
MSANCFDTTGTARLITDIEFGSLIADKAFESDAVIAELP